MDGTSYRFDTSEELSLRSGVGLDDSTQKHFGVVYTPRAIVDLMLDTIFETFEDGDSLCDPSCGDGEFLVPFAERLAEMGFKKSLRLLHGFDIDTHALSVCRKRLEDIRKRSGIPKFEWKLKKIDAIDTSAWKRHSGQFDFVIGNPPYVRIQHLEEHRRKKIRRGNWNFMSGCTDLFILFFDVGLQLIKDSGRLAYITPSSWMKSAAGEGFRDYLKNNHELVSVHNFGDYQVFPNVTTYTSISIINKSGKTGSKVPAKRFEGTGPSGPIFKNGVHVYTDSDRWTIQSPKERIRFQKLAKESKVLSDVADIHVGIQTLADSVFILPEGEVDLEKGIVRRIVKASVMKDGADPVDRIVIYPYENGSLMPVKHLRGEFPKAYRWLRRHKEILLARDKGKMDPEKWHGYGRAVSILSGFGEKILTSGMNPKPSFQHCEDPNALFYSGYCVKPKEGVNLEKLLNALNGKDMESYISIFSTPFRNGWHSYAKSVIKNFPVPMEVYDAD